MTTGPAGFPPARSAIGLRRVLAVFGLLFCGAAAALFALADWPLPAALLAALALSAAVDLVVLSRRGHRRRPAGSADGPTRTMDG
jgi:membrane protein implicated in regulation of membrane protease activity